MRYYKNMPVCSTPDSFDLDKPLPPLKPNKHLTAMLSMSPEEKIKYLREMATIKFRHRGNYKHKRRFKNPPTGKCVVCGGVSNCQHHVVLLINGGKNSRKNLINICGVCHARVHDWLSVKATPEIKRMDSEFRGVCAPCQ
jgi:hypothetical protein